MLGRSQDGRPSTGFLYKEDEENYPFENLIVTNGLVKMTFLINFLPNVSSYTKNLPKFVGTG